MKQLHIIVGWCVSMLFLLQKRKVDVNRITLAKGHRFHKGIIQHLAFSLKENKKSPSASDNNRIAMLRKLCSLSSLKMQPTAFPLTFLKPYSSLHKPHIRVQSITYRKKTWLDYFSKLAQLRKPTKCYITTSSYNLLSSNRDPLQGRGTITFQNQK